MTEKRYYWLKMPEDFFEQKEIKALRRIAGGDTFTIIYQKMLLKSLQTGGLLFYEGMGKDFVDEISLVLDEKPDNVAVTISFLKQKGLIFSGSKDEYELSKVKLMTGSETSSAERMRRLREKNINSLPIGKENSVTLLRSSDVDIDIDKEIDKDINNIPDSQSEIVPPEDFEAQFEALWKLYPQKSGKAPAKKHFLALAKKHELPDINEIAQKIKIYEAEVNYQNAHATNGFHRNFKDGSTWFNQERWNDEVDPEFKKQIEDQQRHARMIAEMEAAEAEDEQSD